MVDVAQFWVALAEAEREPSWFKPPTSDINLTNILYSSSKIWGGYLEFQWGWRNQWQRRYVLLAKQADDTGYAVTGATSWLFNFSDESHLTKLKGCLHLGSNFANAKLLERKGRDTCCLICLPRDSDGTLLDPLEVGFRVCPEDNPNDLAQFASACLVTAREENDLARMFVRAFDRETYLDDAVDALPHDLVLYVRSYVQSLSAPTDEVNTL